MDSTDEDSDEEPKDLVKVAKTLTTTLERFTLKMDEKDSYQTGFETFFEQHIELTKKKMEEISAEILEKVEKKIKERPTNIAVSTQTEMPPTDGIVRIKEKNLLKIIIPFVAAAQSGDNDDDGD